MASLQQKHIELENEINEHYNNPNFDEIKVTELKKQKLKVKDEITQLTGRELTWSEIIQMA